MTQKGEEFRCQECGGTFTTGWSDKEAQAEFATNYPDYEGDVALVCDDCYKQLRLPFEKGKYHA